MSKENNLTDFLTDVADAIREKKGTTDKINPQDFSDEIKGIKTSSSMWTGHVDVEGLKAIGWDDEDIAYFQKYGVNWMEEDDEYYKVSDDNKALYGVITADNIQQYKDRIVWLPKIDTSNTRTFSNIFYQCYNMRGIPLLDTSKSTSFSGAFRACFSLSCAIPLNIGNAKVLDNMYRSCYSLQYVPEINIRSATSVDNMFHSCTSIKEVHVDISSVTKSVGAFFSYCYSLRRISSIIDISGAASISFAECFCLEDFRLFGLHFNINFDKCYSVSKNSILYLINNEAATSAITITLHASAYARLSTDPDIVAALENHPLVSLASA